jgi:hypothetical protein
VTGPPVVAAVGARGSGKTALVLGLARYLGRPSVRVRDPWPTGPWLRWSTDRARRVLTGPDALPRPLAVAVDVSLDKGGRSRQARLWDLPGLTEDAAPGPEPGAAMAAVLAVLVDAEAILHVIDAAGVGDGGRLPAVDEELIHLLAGRAGYAVAAAKADLPGFGRGLSALRRRVPAPIPVLPVSARAARGYPAVLHWIWRQL